jgi:hypothetical protein
MTLLEALAELNNEVIQELGAPLTLIVAGAGFWVSVARYDRERNATVLLEAAGEPDDHLPLLLIFIGPQDRVKCVTMGAAPDDFTPERVN